MTMTATLTCLIFAGPFAHAQDKDVQDMKILIDALKEQIDQLEKRVEDQESKEAVTVERPKGALDVYWKEGLRLDSAELNENGKKPFQLKLGGRIQNDWAAFDLDDELEVIDDEPENGTEFRRARLAISGKIYEDFEFKAQYDFAGGDADFKDVWMAANNIPIVGQLKIGHFKEPGSLDELTSSKDLMFMERALPNLFAPGRNTGFAIQNTAFDKRMTYAAGVFKDSDDFGTGVGDDNYAFTGRVTGLPLYKDDGRQLVHLGAWATIRTMYDTSFRYRQRPEAHLANRYVDTGSIAVDDVMSYGIELASVWGPATVQGEYIASELDTPTGDEFMQGFYVQGGYFLTGEHRGYKTSNGAWDKIKPSKNFNIGSERAGWGAWEVAARYSYLDLDDKSVMGGDQSDITLGLNWYLNPNMKVMLNYVHGEIDRGDLGVDGGFDALQSRFQVTW